MLKNLFIKELDAGIFSNIICKSNNFGILARYFFQNSIVDVVEFITLEFPKSPDKKSISASISLSRLKIRLSLFPSLISLSL